MEASPEVIQEQAREAYRASKAAELVLTGDALGRMYGRSGRWGRDRIAEVRAAELAAELAALPRQSDGAGGSPVVATAGSEDTVPLPSADRAAATALPWQPRGNGVAAEVLPVAEQAMTVATAWQPDGDRGNAAAATPLPPGPPPSVGTVSDLGVATAATRLPRSWPVLLLALPAFVAIWGGWVGLGEMAGFGPVNLLPGIGSGWTINTAITLPIGVEAYAAYALRVWLSSGSRPAAARRFAMWSAIGSLVLGMLGQVAYHLMAAAGITVAPWQITTFVSCLPVVVLGFGAALAHLLHGSAHERPGNAP